MTCTRSIKEIFITFKQLAPSWSPNDFKRCRIYNIEWDDI